MKKLLSLVLALLPLILVSAICAESQRLKLGSISILQGEGASWGTAAKNSVTMAVDALNAQGGVLTVNRKDPDSLGVPVMTPDELDIVTPERGAPTTKENDKGF